MRRCIVCGTTTDKFIPIEKKYIEISERYGKEKKTKPETLNREEYSCPNCYSSDRDRLNVAFIRKLRDSFGGEIRFLEIAPSGALQRYLFSNWASSCFDTADLYMDGVDYKIDIQNMSVIADGSYDFIVCSHVLEHVENDKRAMAELYRILDSRGIGIVTVPIDLNREETDEEWGLSEEENRFRFGQEDHVRAYNKNDYIKRLENAGFGVHQLGKTFFGEKEFEESALTDTSILYVVYKSDTLYGKQDTIIKNFKDSHENRTYISEHKVPTKKECTYYIDLFKLEERILSIWGWVFLSDKDSKKTKVKLMFENEEIEYIRGINFRKRDDIQGKYGNRKKNYYYSGLDVIMNIDDVRKGNYKVYILLQNEMYKYKILLKDNICVN
ncbi:MAG: methyltransferase domain-containing protein [Lachnospiraceae bacterium]|nr:methyltransferase domain-containing protein [Lachnospiraceae bacterium]